MNYPEIESVDAVKAYDKLPGDQQLSVWRQVVDFSKAFKITESEALLLLAKLGAYVVEA